MSDIRRAADVPAGKRGGAYKELAETAWDHKGEWFEMDIPITASKNPTVVSLIEVYRQAGQVSAEAHVRNGHVYLRFHP